MDVCFVPNFNKIVVSLQPVGLNLAQITLHTALLMWSSHMWSLQRVQVEKANTDSVHRSSSSEAMLADGFCGGASRE